MKARIAREVCREMPLVRVIERISAAERQDLIARSVMADPHHPGIAHYCLQESGISIWALVAYYETVEGDLYRVASDYDVPDAQVRAAIAFYIEHTNTIDEYLSSRFG